MSANFDAVRRQPYLSESAYRGTLQHYADDEPLFHQLMKEQAGDAYQQSLALYSMANQKWETFQLKYTAGEDLGVLARELTDVVEAYEAYANALDLVSDAQYHAPITLDDTIDEYVDYLNILSAAVLLHREDLIPRVHGLNAGTDYDGQDLIIETILGFYLSDRPTVDEWFWERPYGQLVEVIDSPDENARTKNMKRYVSGWYRAMKGQAHFWGKHEVMAPDFTEYVGYWAMCAAALTYLFGIDDSAYRDELVYPKELLDYARSQARQAVVLDDGVQLLRVLGGQPCPREGKWFSPAKIDSTRHFEAGEVMPSFDSSEYGTTIWQWISDSSGG